tara:strand:- start:636 stop:1601 length:966 start_codon:yes stop_codon:yes gene_type:complete
VSFSEDGMMIFRIFHPLARIAGAALLLLALGACATQGETAISGMEAQYSAPINFDRDGRPTAEVRINDRAQFAFAIDTAAQRTAISGTVIDALALQPDPEMQAQVHGVGGAATVPMYRLASLELGGRRLEDGYYLRPVGAHAGNSPHDGILGHDMIATGRIVFDFAGRTVRFGAVSSEGLGDSLPATVMFGGFFLVDISIDGVVTTALIDTGASTSFANAALRDALGLAEGEGGLQAVTEVMGVTREAMRLETGFTGDVEIGAVRLADAAIVFTDSPVFATIGLTDRPAIVLGSDVLRRLPGFALDYEAHTFRHFASAGRS